MNIERDLKFLTTEYNLSYKFLSFSKDVSGTFYGPMNTYNYYNDEGCFTVYHAVQRGEWDYYSASRFSENQVTLLENSLNSLVFSALRNKRKPFVDLFKSESKILAEIIREQIEKSSEFFGIKVTKSN